MTQEEIWITSTLDGTKQPSLFFRSDREGKRPLLVGLHTWSYDRFQTTLLPLAEKLGFHLLMPEFRGPNLGSNPHCRQACGSEFARRDVKDAIDYLLETEEIDREDVFLAGLSGGGHMALLMAGTIPEYFKAVAAYVPITDLTKWAVQNENYRPKILACCGADEEEMLRRSPISFVDTIARANVKLFHGRWDRLVPFTQSLDLYRAILEKHPDATVYLDIFDGGHEIDLLTAENWIASQYEKKALTQIGG